MHQDVLTLCNVFPIILAGRGERVAVFSTPHCNSVRK